MKLFALFILTILPLSSIASQSKYTKDALKVIGQLKSNTINTKALGKTYTNHYFTHKKNNHKKALVIVTGVAEPSIKYWEFFDIFKNKYDIYFYDLVNQGASPDTIKGIDFRKVHISDFSIYQDTLNNFLKSINAGYEKIDIISHSTGSHVILKHILKNPNEINRFVAITPMVDVKLDFIPLSIAKLYLKIFYKPTDWAPKQNNKNPDYSYFTNSEINFDNYQYLIYNYFPKYLSTGVTAGWLIAALNSVSSFRDKKFNTFKTPTLFFTGGNDKIVRSSASDELCKKRLSHCQLIHFKKGRHQLHLEVDRIRFDMFNEIEMFLLK